MGSCEPFALTGLEWWCSWAQPSKKLGLQTWVIALAPAFLLSGPFISTVPYVSYRSPEIPTDTLDHQVDQGWGGLYWEGSLIQGYLHTWLSFCQTRAIHNVFKTEAYKNLMETLTQCKSDSSGFKWGLGCCTTPSWCLDWNQTWMVLRGNGKGKEVEMFLAEGMAQAKAQWQKRPGPGWRATSIWTSSTCPPDFSWRAEYTSSLVPMTLANVQIYHRWVWSLTLPVSEAHK
jgi:hypothetical protein